VQQLFALPEHWVMSEWRQTRETVTHTGIELAAIENEHIEKGRLHLFARHNGSREEA